jgi:hypothetical protein
VRRRERLKKRRTRFRFFIILSIITFAIYYFVFKEEPKEVNRDKNSIKLEARAKVTDDSKVITEEAINIEKEDKLLEEYSGNEIKQIKEKVENTKKEYNNSLLIGKNKIYIYYNKRVVLALDKDVNLTKEKTVQNIIEHKNYSELLNLVNYLLPEKLLKYELVENFYNENIRVLSTIDIASKKYVDTYALSEILTKKHYKLDINKNQNIIIDILNANGIGGSAGTTGKKIQKKFAYKYTAANYETRTKYSYIINKTLSQEELENLVMALDQKYVKIKKESPISTIADAVIIIGREWGYLTRIFVQTNKKLDSEYYTKLKKEYKNVKRIRVRKKIEENYIEYNPEDYFIAYKVSKLIGIDKMKENPKLKDRININLVK